MEISDQPNLRINTAILLALADGGPISNSKLCVQLIKTFSLLKPTRIELIRKALSKTDSKHLSELTRTMQTEASSIGADRLFGLLQDLEWQAESASPEALRELAEDVIKEIHAVDSELNSLLK